MKKLFYLPLFALLVFLDRISKIWIVANLKGKENIVIIKNVFEFEYVENTGAAFSSFSGQQTFLIILTSIILLFVLFLFVRVPDTKRYILLNIAFTMLLSGAVGNLIDRVKDHYVVDFLYFVPINFPRFNIADTFICVSVALLFILFVFVYKEDETEKIFGFKKKD